jgi:DNA-binding beta-propeller fold protein YncE
MRRLLVLTVGAAALVFPSVVAATAGGRPVALVTAETSNEVLAVSLGPHGGRVLKRVHLDDPLMVAAPLHGPAVVVDPHGTVTLLGWHSLRPIKVFHGFRTPEVATIAPGDRYAYVADGGSGELVVIDLMRRKVVGHVYVGAGAHHLSFSPDGRRLWGALSEVATTVVRLDTSNPRKPRVVGRVHPPFAGHSVGFAPGGRTAWVSGASAHVVMVFSAATGRLVTELHAGRAPQEIAFARGQALITSGYGSSIESVSLRTLRPLRLVSAPYGSFNLDTYGAFVVTTSLLTGEVSEFRVGDLHRLWTTKVAPAARYVAISVWPGR